MILIDGKKVSEQIRNELKEKISELIKSGKNLPGLVTILVGDNPASHIYVNNKVKACEEIGMRTNKEVLDASIPEEKLLSLIKSYNENDDFHGILVQMPLPKNLNEEKIIEAVLPSKDVDGLHPVNVGNLVIGKETFVSCTPGGIQELLIRYKIETAGKHVVVVGRSNLVGKPIANLMFQKKLNANSVVTVCHSAAKDISVYTKQADILIAAMGTPRFIKGNMVKEGAAVIDVGINRIEDKSHPKGTRIVGDVDFDEVSKKASFITPVPGGVGPMTIAMLLQNTFKAYMQFHKKN
ncbi:MAG: bifunctional methylenetetrahydrofolate dehydrogenase/methenyltetrahydrofolate cyclohydrolase FolD [Ignavibacteria bacterium]